MIRHFPSYVQQQKQQELEQIIAEEKLKPAEAQRFVANAFRDGALKTTGTDIDQILPPVSRFGGGNRTPSSADITITMIALTHFQNGRLQLLLFHKKRYALVVVAFCHQWNIFRKLPFM